MSGRGHKGVDPTHRFSWRQRVVVALELLVERNQIRVVGGTVTERVTLSDRRSCWEGPADAMIAALRAGAAKCDNGRMRRDELDAALASWARTLPGRPRCVHCGAEA